MAQTLSAAQGPIEVITISDITSQIQANAQALFPKEKNLKVVTAQVPSGLIHYCSVLADDAPLPQYPNIPQRPKVLLKSVGTTSRRAAMKGLLEETERRVAREILKIGH